MYRNIDHLVQLDAMRQALYSPGIEMDRFLIYKAHKYTHTAHPHIHSHVLRPSHTLVLGTVVIDNRKEEENMVIGKSYTSQEHDCHV